MTLPLSRRRTALLAAWALLLSGATGCSDNDPVGLVREFGTYGLVRMNGQPLPYSVTTAQGNVVVQSATLVLAAGSGGTNTYTATVNGTRDGTSGVLLTDAGQYSISGTTLTFSSTSVPGLIYPGARSGDVVTVSVPGLAVGTSGTLTLRFEK